MKALETLSEINLCQQQYLLLFSTNLLNETIRKQLPRQGSPRQIQRTNRGHPVRRCSLSTPSSFERLPTAGATEKAQHSFLRSSS